MHPLFLFLSSVLVLSQFAISRPYAFAPLLVAIFTLPHRPVIDVGVSFAPAHLLILAGLLRGLAGRSLAWTPRNPVDLLVVFWAGWTMLSVLAHNATYTNPLTERLLIVYNTAGGYLYGRTFIRTFEDFRRASQWLAILMVILVVPVAYEKVSGLNLSSAIHSGERAVAEIRGGRIRASGPFGHSILAGTAASCSCFVIMGLRGWRFWRLAGIACSLVVVYCSASSGPILTFIAGMMGMLAWRWRRYLKLVAVIGVLALVGLQLAMSSPVWYIIARVDLIGGSTGWHRAELISQAFKHLDRWWFMGTDYTRDWITHGAGWDADQVDITNHYLRIGVTGGLPLMFCFLWILQQTFRRLGKGIALAQRTAASRSPLLWSTGCSLFAHGVALLSISYFDQTLILMWFLIGAVPGLCTLASQSTTPRATSAQSPPRPTAQRARLLPQ